MGRSFRTEAEEKRHGELSLEIVTVARRCGYSVEACEAYETSTNGEAVAENCVNLLTPRGDDRDEWLLHSLVRERLMLLGRDADRALRVAYPDPCREGA